MARSRAEAALGGGKDLIELDVAPALIQRAQRPVHHGDRNIAVAGAELVALRAAAALRKHVELGEEHVAFRYRELLALGIAVPAALNVERRRLMQLVGRIPGAEIDLVMHQSA